MKNYFERIVSKLFTSVFDKPLPPPTAKEIEHLPNNFYLMGRRKDNC